ncbi:MAG: hypothetical protein H6733_06140 [Alphaproteobacteria bacterium]|nr:hypothetical protein [Alphaproteobacteria bacterium]
MAPWSRPVSPLERAWLVADRLYGPFVNQMVVEGDGAVDVDALRAAVAQASAQAPGARVVVRGWVCRSRWEAQAAPPPVREVDGSGWDATSEAGAPFLRDPLDPVDGPTTEVVVVRGDRPRLIVRTAHATMDGGGTIAFAHQVCAVLRGQDAAPLVGTDTDLVLARRLGADRNPPPVHDALPPSGPPEPALDGVTWRRVRVDAPPRGLLGKVAVALAAHARATSDAPGPVRFDVPADLRRALPDVAPSTANLTGMVQVDVTPDSTPAQVDQAVRDAVAAGAPGRSLRGTAFLGHLPLWLMVAASRRGAADHRARGRFGVTGVLSNLGRMDLDALSFPGFAARSVFWIPPGTEVTALFAGFSGSPDGVDLVVTMPRMLADGGRIEAVVDAMAAAMRG